MIQVKFLLFVCLGYKSKYRTLRNTFPASIRVGANWRLLATESPHPPARMCCSGVPISRELSGFEHVISRVLRRCSHINVSFVFCVTGACSVLSILLCVLNGVLLRNRVLPCILVPRLIMSDSMQPTRMSYFTVYQYWCLS
jgi:hypothetical protein